MGKKGFFFFNLIFLPLFLLLLMFFPFFVRFCFLLVLLCFVVIYFLGHRRKERKGKNKKHPIKIK